VSLTKVVVRSLPLNLTVEERRKPVPFTVIVNCGLPTNCLGGKRRLIAGKGLDAVTTRLTVFETELSGFATVIGYEPGLISAELDIEIANLPPLT
jgi:hypothetical protein